MNPTIEFLRIRWFFYEALYSLLASHVVFLSRALPQLAEIKPPQPMDAVEEVLL